MIDRAYLLYGLHPAPKRVLVIGLSSGAWTRIIGSIPGVEKIDVVEINPGYIEMIRAYPHLSLLIDDPRLSLHIDDGRRWLRRSHEKFDLIVMNTTYHWRANITNLLSVEMMNLIRESLAPEGIFAFNTTNSFDAFYTASEAFPHAYLFRNFVYAAKHDFRDQLPLLTERLRQFKQDGQPLFPNTLENESALAKLASIKFIGIQQITDIYPRPLLSITDQNMITEFRFGRWSAMATE
jgi:spermidine synthase